MRRRGRTGYSFHVKSNDRCLVVLVTAPRLAVARKLAAAILEAKMAACINLLRGVESHYIWRGKRERSNEVLLLIKTTGRRLAALRSLVEKLHPYEVPEFIALPISAGSRPYLQWLKQSVA